MSKELRLAKKTAIIAIGNLCTKGISFLLLPLYTSILNAEDYGAVDMVTTYSGFVAILLTLQLEQGLFRFLVEARDNPERQREYIQTALLIVTGVMLVFVTVGAYVLSRVSYAYTGYFLLNVVVHVFGTVILQIPRGMGHTGVFTVGNFIIGAATVLLNVLFLAVLDWGVEGMIVAGILGNTACSVYVVLRMRLHTYFRGLCIRSAPAKEILRFSLPLIPYTLCWWVIGASDRVIINYSIGIAANGIYAIANKFSSLYNMASGIFQTAWMESAYESAEDQNRNSYYSRMINKSFRFYTAANIVIITLLSYVFSCFVDSAYAEAYAYIPILLTAAMFHSVSAVYGAVYFTMKLTTHILGTAIVTALINVLVNLVMIREWGLYAAAFSTLVAYGILVGIRCLDMRKRCGISLDKSYIGATTVVYVIAVVGYYSSMPVYRVAALVTVIVYALFGNRQLIADVYSMLKARFKR